MQHSTEFCTAHFQVGKIISNGDFEKCAPFWNNSRGKFCRVGSIIQGVGGGGKGRNLIGQQVRLGVRVD